ncbi:MAG: hypothetical protein GX230_09990 [Lentisphaerae bacterium]|nr:hypothetical protein [Lentisphaerota bacterium]
MRRLRAQERAKRAPLLRALRRRVERAETKIAELEQEQQQLTTTLSTAAPDTNFAEISRRLRNVQHELHRNALEWEEAATALEQAEQE